MGFPLRYMKINTLFIATTFVGIATLMSSCENKSDTNNMSKANETTSVQVVLDENIPVKTLEVAIINSDTVLGQYDFASKLRDDLTTQSLKYQNILRQKESVLMGEMQKLQAEAATLSQFEGERRQRKLYEDQEKLRIKQDEYSQKLMVLEQQYNRDIDSAINEFLERYCSDKPFQMVLSNTDLGMIRWFNPAMDITNEVLAGLNEEYAAQQAAVTTPEAK